MAARLLDLLDKHVQKPARPSVPEGGITDDDLDKRIMEALSRVGVVPKPGRKRS